MSLLTLFQKNVTPVTYSIWNTNEIPAELDGDDASNIVVGTRFQSSSAGTITGIRWYKGGTAAGTHTVSLWTNAGTSLASIVVTGETSTGWQEMLFTTPVSISASTTYVAVFHTTDNLYQRTGNYFGSDHVQSPLTALATSTTPNFNGVYKFSTTSVFPNQYAGLAPSYFIDVVFKEGAPAHATTGVLTGPGSTIVGSAAHKAKHTTTGVLTGQGSSIVGASAHKAKHTTTGVLAGLVSAIAGTSRRFRNHPTNGVLTGQSSTIVGSAAHKAKHTTTGVLTGQASTIVGAAKRFITHITSGVLTGQGSIIVGSASRASASNTHVTSGVLTGQASSIVGSAAHKAKHTTTGVLTGQVSSIAGTSAHKAKHTTSGALVGQSAIITGSSVHKAKHTTTGTLIGQSAIITGSSVNSTSVITKRFGIAYWKPDEKDEPIEPIVEETVEEWTEPDLFEKLKETRTMHEAIIKKAQQAELMEEQQKIRLRKAQDDQIIEMYLRSKR